jgi:hypothetical protein
VGPRTGLNDVERRKVLPPTGLQFVLVAISTALSRVLAIYGAKESGSTGVRGQKEWRCNFLANSPDWHSCYLFMYAYSK